MEEYFNYSEKIKEQWALQINMPPTDPYEKENFQTLRILFLEKSGFYRYDAHKAHNIYYNPVIFCSCLAVSWTISNNFLIQCQKQLELAITIATLGPYQFSSLHSFVVGTGVVAIFIDNKWSCWNWLFITVSCLDDVKRLKSSVRKRKGRGFRGINFSLNYVSYNVNKYTCLWFVSLCVHNHFVSVWTCWWRAELMQSHRVSILGIQF